MGAIEAINFASQKQGAGGISAVFLISSSTSENAEPLYQFKETDLVDKVSKFTIPSLYITSDKDCMHNATKTRGGCCEALRARRVQGRSAR